jgi:hypothetical protein
MLPHKARHERRAEPGFQLELHGPRGQKAELLEINMFKFVNSVQAQIAPPSLTWKIIRGMEAPAQRKCQHKGKGVVVVVGLLVFRRIRRGHGSDD